VDARRLLTGAEARPFWTLVGIRVAYWAGAALALVWAPLRHDFPPFEAYDARSDLLFLTFAQWDSGWFLRIADHGYDIPATSAFFPAYPLVARAVGVLLGSTLVAAVLVALVAAGIAAVLVWRIARAAAGEGVAGDAVLLLALYPSALVFTGAYSDGLFLAFAAGSVLAAMRGRGWTAGVLGGLAVGTRLFGLALVPALLVLLWPRDRSRRELVRSAPVLLLPAALGLYCLYLDHRFGDPFAFANAQSLYWLRETSPLGPIGGLWDSISAAYHGAAELARHLPRRLGEPEGFPDRDRFALWNVLHLLLLAAALWLTWFAWRRLGPALGLYAVGIDAAVLSGTHEFFPLASLPRYLLANFPLFIALALLLRDRPRAREATLIAFGAVGAVAAVAFSRHVWIH
jgi:Mannosyltransferase (PIG-V)